MTERIVRIESACSLSLRDEQLVLSYATGEEKTVPLEDLSLLLVDSREVTFTVPAMEAVSRYGALAVLCDASSAPSAIVTPLHANVRQTRRYGQQMRLTDEEKDAIWEEVVRAKIRNQAAALDYLSLDGGDDVRRFADGDGVAEREGVAADVYWKRLFGRDFRRDRFGSGPNALLNYGYAVLRNETVKALLCAGLHPCFGLHHSNQYDDFVLADDVMEPFRVFVDVEVYRMWTEGKRATDRDVRRRLVGVLLSGVKSGGRTVQLRHGLAETAASLVARIDGASAVTFPSLC